MSLEHFIKPELLILIPVLYITGIGLKKSRLKDALIPITLGAISIVLSTLWVISTSEISTLNDLFNALFISTTQGILCAGTSVYANQIYIQSRKKE